ncbi:CAZyme family GH18 [Penicillium roqueforti]|nr:CAZyme family GH18 [Penicillium roqueforti]
MYGPQVPGTVPPTNGTKLAELNPCPLNSCCDVWGQCGITSEYCTDTGHNAPGTAATGTNGCISNCGTDIANNGSAPSTFRQIAYFEAFNVDRPCLNIGVHQLDTSKYTHVHFAFRTVTSDFEVDIEKYRFEFNQFVQLKGVKRIVSLGGWAFSTESGTYNIFRQAVISKNREIFATNVASFVNHWNLDGIDFDWEYPGKPDIPSIPEGSDGDGKNYSAFLSTLRKKLPKKSISVAAPASYWYLKGYPVADMDAALDYWVYMTYDLHGQWDHGSSWSDPGCPAGNCLRSHVNLTETLNSLAMITKAGVDSNKVVIGLSNYGRSFQMTTAGCTGPMCTYTGKESGATPGRCTNTAGLLADAEIYEIIKKDATAKTWVDKDSDSNILVYDSVQWVAYMDTEIRKSRTALYREKNLGGMVEWAVDLEQFESAATPSSSATSTAPAASSTAVGPDSVVNPYLYTCTKEQQKIINEAWQEASELAKGHYQWWPGGK